MDNDITDTGCTCFLGNAPCVFCTETYECEGCKSRVETQEQCELGQELMLCDDCIAERDEQRDDGEKLMASIRQAAGGHYE